ncbi:UNVERIFIED_CONTAM: hypothetical protein Sindi_1283100, partial [Sesamum indicum]
MIPHRPLPREWACSTTFWKGFEEDPEAGHYCHSSPNRRKRGGKNEGEGSSLEEER